jgi:starvation-inducible DNA-binding protein
MTTMRPEQSSYTVAGLSLADGHKVACALQDRLNALNDLQLTLKHVHWNVVGPDFIGVHEMLDPQIEAVRAMVDATAERMATMGVTPVGTPGAIVADRTWDDYSLGRGTTQQHLAALDLVYAGVTADHRRVIDEVGKLDPITEDLLITQTGELEQFHWFIRAHLETPSGDIVTEGAHTEQQAADQAS